MSSSLARALGAEKALTSRVACRFIPSNEPVSFAYGVLRTGQIGRRDCTVIDPVDIPTTRALSDTRALLDTLYRAYIRNDTTLFREETIQPPGDQGGDTVVIPHGLLLGFYLRVLAKTVAADRTQTLARALSKDVAALVVPILTKPDRRRPGSRGAYMEESVVGIAELVKAIGTADIVAWPLLWVWAADSHAQARTRVYVMQALEAMIHRGVVPVNTKMLTLVEGLQRSLSDWETMWPTYSDEDRRERALTVAQANSTIATAAEKLASKGIDTSSLQLIPQPPMPRTIPWVPLLGAGTASVGLVILALWVRGRSKRPKALTRRPRRR